MRGRSVCVVLTIRINGVGETCKIKNFEMLGTHFDPYVTGLVSSRKKGTEWHDAEPFAPVLAIRHVPLLYRVLKGATYV
jgi:hypothetical protein